MLKIKFRYKSNYIIQYFIYENIYIMILDYSYNRTKRNLSVSYIKENGMKALLNFNVDRFKTYYLTPSGKYENWDGSKCDVKWVDKPHNFDIKTYLEEIPPFHKPSAVIITSRIKEISGKTEPR
mgnify:CR=1 FL=1